MKSVVSVAYHSAGLAVEFDRASAGPAAEAGGGVHLREATRHGEQEGEGVFGDGARADSGSVGDGDAMLRGTGEIDVVGSGAPAGEQAQLGTGGEDARAETRRGADVEHDFGRADAFDQPVFGAGQGVVIVELGACLKGGEDAAGSEDGG
jgi:hypothetical protein